MTVDPQNSFTLRRGIELRRTPLDDLMAAIMDARVRVWIASPFVGGAVAEEVREHLADLRGAGRKLDLRGLTNLNRGALIGGFSSVDGLPALLGAGVTMRAASNLHAKIIVVDRRFALVGSANLTSPGRGAGDRNNAELGVIFTTPADLDRVADVFSSWWNELGPSEQFTDQDLEGLPSMKPARWAFDPIKGRDLSVPVPVTTLQRRRKSAMNALRGGLIAKGHKLPKSDLVHFPDQDTDAYRGVNRLRHRVRGDRSENQETRAVLLEVLSRHRDPAARAHAAYRLATDDWLHHGAKTEIPATLAERVKTDPAWLVQKRSQFALAQLD